VWNGEGQNNAGRAKPYANERAVKRGRETTKHKAKSKQGKTPKHTYVVVVCMYVCTRVSGACEEWKRESDQESSNECGQQSGK